MQRVPRIRPAVLLAAAGAFAVLTELVWHTRGPLGWERPIIVLLRHEQLPMDRPLILLWQPLPFAAMTVGLAWAAWKSNRVQLALSGALGCAAAVILTERVLKPLVARHSHQAGSAVFPSGHVTGAAATAMFAWFVIDERVRIRSALILVPTAVAWAVVSERLHFPTDAVAGMLVGGLAVYGVVVGAERLSDAIRLLLPGPTVGGARRVELPERVG
jgi:membrane-associated phospholipid phosphatase